jgi:hypothetical protein
VIKKNLVNEEAIALVGLQLHNKKKTVASDTVVELWLLGSFPISI